eukprot:TRINITY_DN7920_c0_g1_i11.p1 TRINITY_DN7920_c0_g1~~TRINITY_DN7920_c0_g1_i11.p1  ORF type:complete len:183 (+),score=56.49 TRINITY_DN7920_c0_g1_i11:106-654(+)
MLDVSFTTITKLRSLAAPNKIPLNNRVAPTETTIWGLNVTMTAYKHEDDDDYHLVLQDSRGNTMIAEIPAPSCVSPGSPFKSHVTYARSQFDAVFNATSKFKTTNQPVVIKGIGFFDFIHGQKGVAPNGIELHPVIDIEFPSDLPRMSLDRPLHPHPNDNGKEEEDGNYQFEKDPHSVMVGF